MAILVFISHASQDAKLASLIATLFRTAFRLGAAEIRCTSVDGYRLPAGAETDDQLRKEIVEAPVVVGILSASSMASTYVLFELGARWGRKAFLAPILAPGTTARDLAAPISNLNALYAGNPNQLQQLIAEVSLELGVQAECLRDYQSQIDEILIFCKSQEGVSGTTAASKLSGAVTPLQIRILGAIAGLAKGPWEEPSVKDIADAVGMPLCEAEYVLEIFEQKGLVISSLDAFGTRLYSLGRDGREFMIENGSSALSANQGSERR